MSDKVMRHIISALALLIFCLVYWAAYISGGKGWWWTAFGLIVFYAIVYKLVDA